MSSACQVKGCVHRAWLRGRHAQWGGMTAVCWLLIATVAGSDSFATCPPKPEKLYTPNETQIKALIERLEPFEQDMRGVLQDLKSMKAADNTNRIVGKAFGYKEVMRQSNKALCASANAMSAIGPNKVTSLKLYAAACSLGDDVGEALNDLIDCAKGNCLGMASQFAKAKKGALKKGLGSSGESLLGQAEFQEKTAKVIGKIDAGVKNYQDGDKPGVIGTACGVTGTGLKTPLGKGGEAAEKLCAAAVAAAKAKSTYDTVQALDSVSQENQVRLAQQIQVLETKVSAVSDKIKRLRVEVYAINWGAMAKPEPIMTPMNEEECEDEATDEEIQRSLAKMKKPSGLKSLRSASPAEVDPAEAEPSFFNAETLGAVLQGTTQALSAISAERTAKNNASQKEGDCPNGIRPTGTGQYVICREPGRAIGFQGNADVGKDPPIDPLGGGGYSGRKHISGR